MDLKLAGKTALITGGSKGIGRATAEVFAAEGCNVIIVSRTAEALAQVKSAIAQKSNVRVDTVAADLSDSTNVDRLAQEADQVESVSALVRPGQAADQLIVTGVSAERVGDLAHELGVRLHELYTERASLEEAYMELTADSVQYGVAAAS